MAEELYLQTDDRLDIGDEPIEYTDPKVQAIHDEIMKNRKQILEQCKKQRNIGD